MQKITLELINNDNIGTLSPEQIKSIHEIFLALIQSGGLTGVRGGQTIIHFDGDANFMGIELDYWPFRRRKKVV